MGGDTVDESYIKVEESQIQQREVKMKISLVFFTCLGIASALPLEANFHKHQNVCSAPNGNPDANCEVDLTIAVDFSLSMRTKANIYEVSV